MLPKDTQIFASYHPSDESSVSLALEQVKTAGWCNIILSDNLLDSAIVSQRIQQSSMLVVFLSKSYAHDDRLMLEEFAYASTVVRKPFLAVWIDSLSDIRQGYGIASKKLKDKESDDNKQLISALEMLTAKQSGTVTERLVDALAEFVPDIPPYMPSKPQICEKLCEAYEGDKPYIFISYAHDDAIRVYPIVKELFETGWDLWYDEGIKTTERYLPVIADHLKRSTVFVLLLTNRCLDRPFVMNYELEYAKQLNIPIVPVLLENLNPSAWVKEIISPFLKTAIKLDTLLMHISALNLPNHGARKAVPPAIKQNVVYDVVLPPELPGFEYSVQGDEITINKYVGKKNKVVIPDTVSTSDGGTIFRVTSIKEDVFLDYTDLDITLPESGCDWSFKRHESLTNITIRGGITSIGTEAFTGCTALTSVSIPQSVTDIRDRAFYKCYLLSKINIPEGVTRIGNQAFASCKHLKRLTIPDSVLSIGNYAFFECTKLNYITISQSITEIEDSTFGRCYALASITIPKGVTKIGEAAFMGCSSLTDITIPVGVTSIAKETFSECSSLINVIIPEGVTSIHFFAFQKCEKLTKFIVPKSITYLDEYAFYFCPIEIPRIGLSTDIEEQNDKTNESESEQQQRLPYPSDIPCCEDKPYALLCCTKEDLGSIREMLVELYWEGFNVRYEEVPKQQSIDESSCVLAFFTKHIAGSTTMIEILKQAIQRDASRIIQVFLEGCFDWPDEIRYSLHDRQAIMQSLSTEQEFSGRIRGSLREFGCSLGRPRGFETRNIGNAVEITKFHPTGFPRVIIPKTFFNPPLPVISIGDNAFAECLTITGITLPDSVVTIGEDAFRNCEYLTDINIPNNVTTIGKRAFRCCFSLTNITIPERVYSIGEMAFNTCSSLVSITLPNGITDIDIHVFSHCTALTSITIPESVTVIGENAFHGCESLSSISLPESLTRVESNAFLGCENLTGVLFPASIEYVAKNAFEECSIGLPLELPGFKYFMVRNDIMITKYVGNETEVTIPDTVSTPDGKMVFRVTRICNGAFQSCKSVTSIFISDSVTTIEGEAFSYCDSLASIIVDKENNSFASKENVLFNKEMTTLILYPVGSKTEKYSIPEGVTNIGDRAFQGAAALTSVTIPDSVTKIGNNAFRDCSALVSITIPNSVSSIGCGAFAKSWRITDINIPKGIVSIDASTFAGCSLLNNVTIPDSVTSIGESAFQYCNSLTNIIIPKGVISINDYAFNKCTKLLNITIPGSVLRIGKDVFKGCPSNYDAENPKIIAMILSIIYWITKMRSLVIHCPFYSKAWRYAQANGIKHRPLLFWSRKRKNKEQRQS